MACRRFKNNAMNFSCKNINAFGTRIVSPASHPSTPCPESLGIHEPLSFALCGGKKNGLWSLWPRSSDLLRPEDPQDSRSALCGQTHLSGSGISSSHLSKVRESEAGEAGLVGRLSFLHQAICFLRGSPVPGFEYPGRCQRVSPGLANGQGLGDAVHARDTAASRYPRAEGHRD